MQRHRIPKPKRNATFSQSCDKIVSNVTGSFSTDFASPKIINMAVSFPFDGRFHERDFAKHIRKFLSQLDPRLDIGKSLFQLRTSDGSNRFGHPKVATDDARLEFPVVDSFLQVPSIFLAVSDYHPTFAALDMLVDVEAEHPDMADGTGIDSITDRIRSLGVVLDQDDAVVIAEGPHLKQGGGTPEQVNDDDGFGGLKGTGNIL